MRANLLVAPVLELDCPVRDALDVMKTTNRSVIIGQERGGSPLLIEADALLGTIRAEGERLSDVPSAIGHGGLLSRIGELGGRLPEQEIVGIIESVVADRAIEQGVMERSPELVLDAMGSWLEAKNLSVGMLSSVPFEALASQGREPLSISAQTGPADLAAFRETHMWFGEPGLLAEDVTVPLMIGSHPKPVHLGVMSFRGGFDVGQFVVRVSICRCDLVPNKHAYRHRPPHDSGKPCPFPACVGTLMCS